jgi:small subunit ribosomal protein S1
MTSKSNTGNTSFSMDDFAKALQQQDDDFQKGQIVRGKVHSYEKNGVYVDIGGKSLAFVPAQEVGLNAFTDLGEVLPLNEEEEFLIIREQDAEGQLTLSLKQLKAKQAWDSIAEMQDSKQSVQVKVTGVNKGGVTVEFQGARGFIPRSHLLEKDNLDGLVGQNLTASFLEVDPEAKKLVLSQREATRSASFNQLELGQLIEGKVASIKPFGLFVDFDGNTGLIHVKQVSQTYIESLTSLFQVGQQVKAIIVDLDPGKNRISLSIKVLENYAGEAIEDMAEVMSSADSRAHRAAKKLLES